MHLFGPVQMLHLFVLIHSNSEQPELFPGGTIGFVGHPNTPFQKYKNCQSSLFTDSPTFPVQPLWTRTNASTTPATTTVKFGDKL